MDSKVCAACGWNSWSSVGMERGMWWDNAAPLLFTQSHSHWEKSKGYWQRRWHVLWVKIKYNTITHSMHPDMFVKVSRSQWITPDHATYKSAWMWKSPGIDKKHVKNLCSTDLWNEQVYSETIWFKETGCQDCQLKGNRTRSC